MLRVKLLLPYAVVLFSRYNLLVPEDKFQETFGEKWSDVLKEGRGVNAMEACKLLFSV
jgi:hypothetical protein